MRAAFCLCFCFLFFYLCRGKCVFVCLFVCVGSFSKPGFKRCNRCVCVCVCVSRVQAGLNTQPQPRHEKLGFSPLLCSDPPSMGCLLSERITPRLFLSLSHAEGAALGSIDTPRNQ